MIVGEIPYIKHKSKKYRCYIAGYNNPVSNKWGFVIDGVDSPIYCDAVILFFGMKLKVSFTLRRQATATKCFTNCSGSETYIEAWQCI